MTKRDKLLKKIRNNPQAVTFEELHSLLEAFVSYGEQREVITSLSARWLAGNGGW